MFAGNTESNRVYKKLLVAMEESANESVTLRGGTKPRNGSDQNSI